MTGSGELRALVIDPKAVDPEDTETLADLVVAAVQAANENAQALQQEKLGPLAQGLGGGGSIPGPAVLIRAMTGPAPRS
ncbi:Nucleoid-associated protein OS=Streptomyces microflavus OX=1919 GN=G3I39_26760 PE=3 SV=1 [Streptomyces microflavus]